MLIALQMDALPRLNHAADSTLELARAAAERGHSLFHYEPTALSFSVVDGKRKLTATGAVMLYRPEETPRWSLGAAESRDLSGFDVVLMRQDPPFDLSYIAATHMLEALPRTTRVINDPAGVRNAPEKWLITDFPHFLPPTLVTRDIEATRDFRAAHGDIVIKPLFGFGGHGVFHLRPDDDNLPALLESLSAAGREPWMAQKFLPVSVLGDKRILMLDGEAVGCFRRMPPKGDMRGNLRIGAVPEAAPLNVRDREICAALGPVLRERGLFFAGVDVIGDWLTEINVTSPTGLVIADRLEGRAGDDRLAERFWMRVETT